MSKNLYAVILGVAVITVFAVWTMKNALQPALEEPTAVAAADSPGMGGDPEAMMNDVKQQIQHLQELEKSDPDNPQILTALGNLYYDAGMAEQAVEYYDRVLKLQPDNIEIKVDKASMLRMLGRSAESVAILREIVAAVPEHEQAWFNLGVIYGSDLNDAAGAMDAWKKYLAISPNAPHADAIRQEIARLEKEIGG